ncbi:16S rRNA (guanine(527)-N(7))-methyltransferase RsmG [Hyphobacterium sp. HN65]|uniref:Ribosomal RNA small subunit methyltransferase G n=1 Tax=Hyphobacterium lacteum TaxID=3116575 RepID=A0ABU7LTE4_9PROT|nr:16S rRNA (guanine(527)-N(7))-methyltransferase RsmG [Hyphobacterium sp. HN65]MEE2526619.1 16S rRNA (guanine(527)-N(7))-methyltransferase RsmG [Hyphobacterium sp. HN65]
MSFTSEDFQKATGVSRETLEAFERWRLLLDETNRTTNLVGRSTMADFWKRHALDGIQLLDHAPENGKSWLDFGAGAGIPGIAIALAMKDCGLSESTLLMVESVGKKARFIERSLEVTGAPGRIENCRIEALDPENRFDVITARAVAALDKLLWYTFPLLKSEGICLFPKGQRYRQELTDARKYWTFDEDVLPSLTSDDGVILRLSAIRPKKGNRHARHPA